MGSPYLEFYFLNLKYFFYQKVDLQDATSNKTVAMDKRYYCEIIALLSFLVRVA